MAATAYASLASSLNTMDHIHIHPLLPTFFNNYPTESLCEKLDFFLDFVENHPDPDSEEAKDLFRQITYVVRMAEDRIVVEAADRVREESTKQSPGFLADLHKSVEEMDIIKENVVNVKIENRQPTYSMPPPSSSDPSAIFENTTMVGLEGYLEQLLDQLTGYSSNRRRIIPIVGMGGIGKTTLAKTAYENSLILSHFSIRAWVTVSQEFTSHTILSQIIFCIGESTGELNINDVELGEKLYKTLFGRRYLIVLDDVWSVDAWEKIMFYFPENNNGSRVVITTRQSQVVDYFGSSALSVNFLDDNNSWKLFCENIFGQQGCPLELVEVGKKIVKRCKGLPLAIVVIVGILVKSSRAEDYWEEIAKDKSLILDSEEGSGPLNILYLSYKHLPVRLRSCFLYLGLFPEDEQIDVFNLIKLWVAEGFIKPNKDKSLEDVAERYLHELIRRNLVLVSGVGKMKKLKRCYLHDLVRDLCIRIAQKEDFLRVERDIDGFIVDKTMCKVHYHAFREEDISGFPFRQFNFRFFVQYPSISSWELPSSIYLLWSLQTLIGSGLVLDLPLEIWEMPQLRHINACSIRIPDPPSRGNVIVLQNLQSLKTIHDLNFTEEVCRRIPNIKDLNMEYYSINASLYYNLRSIGCLNKLESLHYTCYLYDYSGESWMNLKLPSSLKELRINGCNLVWSDMAIISLLPHLEIMELLLGAVRGAEWNCVEEEFRCLKHLRIEKCGDLVHWSADCTNFPVLETLTLKFLSNLEEVPSDIGEIPTLELINMYACSDKANISALKILEEQENLGNLNLQVEASRSIELLENW